jgi:RimJ/RimL family protein N-acetyltransferase
MHLSELKGRAVRLEPLSPVHRFDLWETVGKAEHRDLWRYIFVGPFSAFDDFSAFIDAKAGAGDAQWFAVVSQQTQRPQGILSLMREDKANRVIEVGGIVLGPNLQRTCAATEAQYLLARHVFETLKYRRYEWKCDNGNEPSKRAAARLGFTFEGVFRQHMIVKDRNRDTAWFSMLDTEWPARKAAFETWLDAQNFDEFGRQKVALYALNARPQTRMKK